MQTARLFQVGRTKRLELLFLLVCYRYWHGLQGFISAVVFQSAEAKKQSLQLLFWFFAAYKHHVLSSAFIITVIMFMVLFIPHYSAHLMGHWSPTRCLCPTGNVVSVCLFAGSCDRCKN